MLKVSHNAGFFSCCSVRLDKIVEYFNRNKHLPESVDSSEQFELYKPANSKEDITDVYFVKRSPVPPENIFKIYFRQEYQFWNYKRIKFPTISPFIANYFSPSSEIQDFVKELEATAQREATASPICVLFHRGNDKATETPLCPYDEYIKRARAVQRQNPSIYFFIQSDETEFIEKMTATFPNSFYFKDKIRHIPKSNTTVDAIFKDSNFEASKMYLAITIFMSRCAHIIFGSGNCSLWILLYRGNANNVHQYLDGKWL